ncbi:MAG TPA: acetate kinase [Candidatus Binatia bacterium]|nr:acetate kinase [Candidatus Binatia bacterium]
MKILVLNSGSSSQKACLYEIGETLPAQPADCLWQGTVEFGSESASLAVQNSKGASQKEEIQASSRADAVRRLLGTLTTGSAHTLASFSEIHAVGHRVVHGGPDFDEPVLVTPAVRKAISRAAELAPLHVREEVEGMELVQEMVGAVPQIAVFDTGFHRTIPPSAAVYPGPYKWFEQGIRRYGFHGINHQYCAGRAANMLDRNPASLKLVSCHLGNGCSVAAIDSGRSVDTSMGFTPLEGLMMGTRSGSVDPGILTYLMRQKNLSGGQLDDILNKKSGLLGISGVSGDMRKIESEIEKGNERARLAFDIFVHRLRSGIGSMVAVLGGIDALIFTAGIGEHSAKVRSGACGTVEILGIQIDPEKNRRPMGDADISHADSRVRVLVIHAQEDWAIATECWKLLRSKNATDHDMN